MKRGDSARERIEKLVDKGSFYEVNLLKESKSGEYEEENIDEGVITGYGKIGGKRVYFYSQDSALKGGALGYRQGKKIVNIIDEALNNAAPIIGINDSSGARIQEGVSALAAYGDIFKKNVEVSGKIPQICIIAGNCAGGAVYSPGLMDFVFVIDHVSKMYVTGPKVIKEVTGESCTEEELGGARVHVQRTGNAHFLEANEDECYSTVRKLIGLLAETKGKKWNTYFLHKSDCNIQKHIPENSRKIYDIHKVLEMVLDDDSLLEIKKEYAANIVTALGQLKGKTLGIVANQPNVLCGVIDGEASLKAAEFVRFCTKFKIPVLTLVDVPGFMPGLKQEHDGIIKKGSQLLQAYAQEGTIKITVILRKAYGGAYIAMGSRHLGADAVYALPLAEIAVLGADSAVEIINKRDLEKLHGIDKQEKKAQLIQEYNKNYCNTKMALDQGYVDEIVQPSDLRTKIYHTLLKLNKRGDEDKHESAIRYERS